jgi:hypothetical protein
MFHRLQRLDETTHTHNGVAYEIRIFKSADDGHLRVYVSTAALSDVVVLEAAKSASIMTTGSKKAAVAQLIAIAMREIDEGRLVLE